jgi:cytochrome P450
VTTLDDVDQLTTQRFRRMSPGNQQKLPPVDASALPPGPRWPVLLQTAGLLRFRHRFHPYMRKKYGDIFTVRIAPGGRPLVFFTRPEHAKEIFAGDPEVFHAGKANGILGPIMGEHSLLLQDSSQHKRARKLLMPAFNGHALREYQDLVTEVARAEIATWRDGEEFRSLDRMNRLTLEVILRVVFGVTDEELRDQLVTLLLAGHETTATALAWTLHELGKDPEQERRAREAATTGDDDHLEAVLKESMRLHPVIPMVVRHLMRPATIGGIDLPAGTNVGPSILITHAREENYPEPEAFRPERFLSGEVAANTWIPFGGGVRRCIGAGFSLMEGVAVLREVLLARDVTLPPHGKDRPKVRNITSVPQRGARIVVHPR